MANKNLINGLKKVKKLQLKGRVYHTDSFKEKELTALLQNKFLQEIIRTWYYLRSPAEQSSSTSWNACFYEFIHKYLTHKHKKSSYCLCAVSSLTLHTKDTVIPTKISVILKKGSIYHQKLLHGKSIYAYPDGKNFPFYKETIHGINVMTLEYALCKVSPTYWKTNSTEVQILLSIMDLKKAVEIITDKKFTAAAARIAGGLNFINRKEDAKTIISIYNLTFGESLYVKNPFEEETILLVDFKHKNSIVSSKISAMWNKFRDPVFLIGKDIKKKPFANLIEVERMMDSIKKDDIFHSLSIEGYNITKDLVERVTSEKWHSFENEQDIVQKDAMAARGYHEAFDLIKKDILNLIGNKDNPGEYIKIAHKDWFIKLFTPSLMIGVLKPIDLMGYRNNQIYIEGSSHIPFNKDDLLDALDTYFYLLSKEEDSFVKAVLGHHLFGYIHPYMDGNGRMARFIMNTFLVEGGYDWCIIPVDSRNQYMESLENASVKNEIEDFAEFIKKSIQKSQASSNLKNFRS